MVCSQCGARHYLLQFHLNCFYCRYDLCLIRNIMIVCSIIGLSGVGLWYLWDNAERFTPLECAASRVAKFESFRDSYKGLPVDEVILYEMWIDGYGGRPPMTHECRWLER